MTGASSGLGRRMALDLAARGATVVGVARSKERLDEVLAGLRLHSAGSTVVACDVSDVESWVAALGRVAGEIGGVDLLVNSAGIEQRTAVEDADFALYRRIFETNFFALVAGTLAVVPKMLAKQRGAVLNVSSDHGRAPGPYTPAYSASKAAVSAFTESLAHEIGDRGVHVHVLYPGWVPTALGQGAVDGGMPPPPKGVRRTEEQVSRLALDRIGRPSIEINAARIATLAPVARALAPAIYRRTMRKQRGTVVSAS